MSTRATGLLQTSSQSEAWAESYELPKSRESKPGQFQDFSLGVPGQKAIRMWVPQSNADNTIWGKVMASPKSGPWWILWIQSCLWFVLAPRVDALPWRTQKWVKVQDNRRGKSQGTFLSSQHFDNPNREHALYIWSKHCTRNARGWGLFDHQKPIVVRGCFTVMQGCFCWPFSLFVIFCYFFYCL